LLLSTGCLALGLSDKINYSLILFSFGGRFHVILPLLIVRGRRLCHHPPSPERLVDFIRSAPCAQLNSMYGVWYEVLL